MASQYGWSTGKISCVPRGRCATGAMVTKAYRMTGEMPATDGLGDQLGVAVPGFAANHAVAARPLRHVERLVGGLHQRLPGLAVSWEDGDAEAQGEVGNHLAVEHHGLIGDRPADPLRHGEGSAAVRAAQHENELVATVASYQVFRPHRGHQDLPREVAEHCVARRMADGVVDFLEMVEVADDERERLARLTSALEFALQV